jgi:hypothetical protein
MRIVVTVCALAFAALTCAPEARAVTARGGYVAATQAAAPATLARRAPAEAATGPVPSSFAPGEAQRARAYIEVRRMRAFVLTRHANAEAEIEQLEAIQRELRDR